MKEKRISFDEIRANNLKSYFLLLVFLGIMAAIGLAIGYAWGSPYGGVIVAIIIASIYALIAYNSGRNMVLQLAHAKKANKQEHARLINIVEGLAIAANIPTPEVYIIKDSARNAFATGRKPEEAAVAVTTGLMESLNREELEGVIAHEISHIKNHDIKVMLLAAVMTGVIILLADIFLRSIIFGGRSRERGNAQIVMLIIGLVLAILSPIIAELIKLAVSRKREFAADAGAAVLTRYPPGLANALRKIQADPDPLVDTANKATAPLYISTPFRKKQNAWNKLFSTHPPIEERIARLEAM